MTGAPLIGAAFDAAAPAAAAAVPSGALLPAARTGVATLPAALSQRFPPVPRPAQPSLPLPPGAVPDPAPATEIVVPAQLPVTETDPTPSDTATTELAAFRDEVTRASQALRSLVAAHRSELADLSTDVTELRDTVAALRTEISSPAPQWGVPDTAVPPMPVGAPHPELDAAAEDSPTETPGPVRLNPPADLTDAGAPTLAAAATVPPAAEPPAELLQPTALSPAEPTAELLEPTVLPPAESAAGPAAEPAAEPAEERPEPTEPAATASPVAPDESGRAGSQVADEADGTTRRLATPDVHAAAAVTMAAARIGLPPAHVEVLKQWVAHGGRGVIEVAHAGGRHRVGLAAIVYAVSTGRQVLVVVPNRESADSWRASLARHAPEVVVVIDEGRRRDADGVTPHVVLSTASTTARRITAGFEPAALLVAIDADRFGTALLAKALDERCEWRLGLSESFRSGSRRLARYADAYFGGTVLTIS